MKKMVLMLWKKIRGMREKLGITQIVKNFIQILFTFSNLSVIMKLIQHLKRKEVVYPGS